MGAPGFSRKDGAELIPVFSLEHNAGWVGACAWTGVISRRKNRGHRGRQAPTAPLNGRAMENVSSYPIISSDPTWPASI